MVCIAGCLTSRRGRADSRVVPSVVGRRAISSDEDANESYVSPGVSPDVQRRMPRVAYVDRLLHQSIRFLADSISIPMTHIECKIVRT